MRRRAGSHRYRLRCRALRRPPGKLKAIARALFEPPVTEQEARSEGFELEDYQTEEVEIWPDNEPAFDVFRRVGTRWRYPAMGGTAMGLDWPAVLPLLDRIAAGDWLDVHDDVQVMESVALATMREFAPKQASRK